MFLSEKEQSDLQAILSGELDPDAPEESAAEEPEGSQEDAASLPVEDVKEATEAEAPVPGADAGAAEAVPSHIPYSRFREVNESKRAALERAAALERELAEARGRISVYESRPSSPPPAASPAPEDARSAASSYLDELLAFGVSEDAVKRLSGLDAKVSGIDERLGELMLAGKVKQQLDHALATVKEQFSEVTEHEVLVAIRDSGGEVDPVSWARERAFERRIQARDAELAALRDEVLSLKKGKPEVIVRPDSMSSEDVAPDAPAGEDAGPTNFTDAKSMMLRLLRGEG